LLTLSVRTPIILPRYILKILLQQLIRAPPICLTNFFKRHILHHLIVYSLILTLYPSRIYYSVPP